LVIIVTEVDEEEIGLLTSLLDASACLREFSARIPRLQTIGILQSKQKLIENRCLKINSRIQQLNASELQLFNPEFSYSWD
jgi:hypothetical protein